VRAEVRTDFVLGSELLYRELCGGVGPVGALVVAATQAACGHKPNELSEDAALCVELLHVYAKLLSRVTEDTGEQGKANNALALMIGDYGLARAIIAAAKVGPTFSHWFGDAIVATCEGLARMMQYPPGSQQAIERYVESVRLVRGASYSLAAKIGARLAGADQRTVNSVGVAGERLGIAVHICEDILALERQDPMTGRRPARVVQESQVSLPLALAVAENSKRASLLARDKEDGRSDEVLKLITTGHGITRATEMCVHYARQATDAVVGVGGDDSPLAALCDLPRRCLASLGLVPRIDLVAPVVWPDGGSAAPIEEPSSARDNVALRSAS
jgi:heptaprenyl diphosphate synthase